MNSALDVKHYICVTVSLSIETASEVFGSRETYSCLIYTVFKLNGCLDFYSHFLPNNEKCT
jgi:hypothetical protein